MLSKKSETPMAAAYGKLPRMAACWNAIKPIILTRSPPIMAGMAKALALRLKTMSVPAATPGMLKGKVTFQKVRQRFAPTLCAAS